LSVLIFLYVNQSNTKRKVILEGNYGEVRCQLLVLPVESK
jgi:hypothetical protein